MTSGIQVRNLTKRFGDIQALADLSLHVDPGEIVTLLGENGAGKSTLMRILATTVRADSGSVIVAGHDLANAPREARAAVGLALADERSLYWRLTGRQNLEYFATLYGLHGSAAVVRVDQLLTDVELSEAADRRVTGYSTGMRARLVIARALVGSPTVLLFDEPTRSLDPVVSVAIRSLVQTLSLHHGLAALYATHDLHEAAAIGSRSLIISKGRIVAEPPASAQAADLEQLLVEAVTA